MTQTTTQLGRTKLAHPDLAFDTDDGGTALHNALVSIWTQVSNHLPSRWTGSVTLLASASTTITHNFGLTLSGLKVIMFESGVQLTDTQVAASYSITQTSVNAIAIQNTTGGSKTFDALIFAYKTVVTLSDLDPSANTTWDTVNGTSWNKSLYVNGPYTVATAQEFENVIILGNLTLNANLTVRGRLVVVGNVTGNGFKFDCDDDVSIVGDVSITGIAAPTMTIGGNLINATTNVNGFVFRSSTSGVGTFTCKGNVTILNPATPVTMKLNCAGSNSSGNNVLIQGNASCSIDTSGSAITGAAGGVGGSIKIMGNLLSGNSTTPINSSGGAGDTNLSGGAGGGVLIYGSFINFNNGTVITSGGAGNGSGIGANGGNCTVYGNISCLSVNTTGGNSTTNASGNGGNFLCYSNVNIYGSLTVSGGSTSANIAFAAGTSGNITAQQGESNIENFVANGGGGGNTARAGGTILLKNLTLHANVSSSSNGGSNNGGAGGSVTIRGYLIGSSTAGGKAGLNINGGTINDAAKSSGAGGTLKVGTFISMVSVSASGGGIVAGINSGDGGTITIYGSALKSCSFVAQCGSCAGTLSGSFGAGGTVRIYGYCYGDVDVSGKNNDTGTIPTKNAGNAGTINIDGDVFGAVYANGGDITDSTGGIGGQGGTVTIGGGKFTLFVRGGDSYYGASGTTGNGGVCGNAININGDSEIDELMIRGGDSMLASGGNLSSAILFNGNVKVKSASEPGWDSTNLWQTWFIIRGGDSTKATAGTANGGSMSGATININGDLISRRSNITIRGGDAKSTSLTAGVGGNARSSISSMFNVTITGNVSLGETVSSWSGNSEFYSLILRGGHGRTQGGHGPHVTIVGSLNIFGAMLIAGGSATNVTGTIGSLTVLNLHSGGNISKVTSSEDGGQATQGAAETTGTGTFRFGGYLTIGTWVVSSTQWPKTRYLARTSQPLIKNGNSINGVCAQVFIGVGIGQALFDSANGANLFPDVAGTAATPSPMIGWEYGGNTIWKYRTFANA